MGPEGCQDGGTRRAAPPPRPWKTASVLSLRAAQPEDAHDVARVHVRSWQSGYRGLIPAAYLDGLRPEQRASRYAFGRSVNEGPHTVVALHDGEICGFATTGTTPDVTCGELLALYVDPDCWRLGVGRRLISDARQKLNGQGFARAILWVLVGNQRAERFYRGDGWGRDDVQRTEALWGVEVHQQRYSRGLP